MPDEKPDDDQGFATSSELRRYPKEDRLEMEELERDEGWRDRRRLRGWRAVAGFVASLSALGAVITLIIWVIDYF
jgi:hypothetical protein